MYKFTSGWPQRISDGVFVNPDTDVDYLEWISKGNSPLPCEVVTVDAREMRSAAYKNESDNIFMEAVFDSCNKKGLS